MNSILLEKAPLPSAAPPPSRDAQEDQQLVKRAKTGDMEAYDELVRRS